MANLSRDSLKVLMMIGRQGPISRTRVARLLDFAPSRITRLAESLMRFRLIAETGYEASTGGRRSSLLTLSADTYVLCGVRLSISAEVEIVFLDMWAKVLAKRAFFLPEEAEPEQLVDGIRANLEEIYEEQPLLKQRLIALGIGVSGLVAPEEGRVLRTRALPHWRDVPLAPMLAGAVGLPVFLENEVAMSTCAELWFGRGRGCRNFIYLNLGRGVRMGMVLEGRLYRGVTGNAGELGHATYRENGPVCYCGNTGCLERYVSTNTFLDWGREALSQYSDSSLAGICGEEPLRLAHMFEAVRAGDRPACALLRRLLKPLGETLAGIANIFDTEKVLIAGGLTEAGPLLLTLLEAHLEDHALPYVRANTRLELAQFPRHGTAIGSGAMVLEKLCAGEPALDKALGRVAAHLGS